MAGCEEFRKNLYLYCYDELSADEKRRLEEHIAECSACAEEFQSARAALQLVNKKLVPGQPARFWADYDASLKERLRRRPVLPKLAAAFVVLFIGVALFMRLQAPVRILPLEDELLLQEIALLTDLGEDLDLP